MTNVVDMVEAKVKKEVKFNFGIPLQPNDTILVSNSTPLKVVDENNNNREIIFAYNIKEQKYMYIDTKFIEIIDK